MLVVFDGNHLAYRAFHTTQRKAKLTNGTLYGMLRMLGATYKQFRPELMMFTWDVGSATERQKLYPEYKANRQRKSGSDLYKQMEQFREIISNMDIHSYFNEDGWEADDVIATICRSIELDDSGFGEIVIVSGDSDLWQLITPNISVYDSVRGKHITNETFFKEYQFSPNAFPLFKAIIGDGVDNIPGIKGVGPSFAKKLVRKAPTSQRIMDLYEENKELVERNHKLIRLADDINMFAEPVGRNSKTVKTQFEQYGFKSLLKDWEFWLELMGEGPQKKLEDIA